MKISAAIISHNTEIPRLVLQSIDFCDQILVVVDSVKPRKDIKRGKLHYYFRPLNNDFASQRNFALLKSTGDWILFLDTDEYLSRELAAEIKNLDKNNGFSGFYLPRIDVCFHQPLRRGETGHTKLLRLARKKAGSFSRSVHETWSIKGRVGKLSSPLYHIKDDFVGGFIDRMSRYAQIDASVLSHENKPFTFIRLFFYPLGKFLQNYFIRLGVLDGLIGLFQAYLMSVQSLTVRIFQWEATKKSSS